MQSSYYSATASDFLNTQEKTILGELAGANRHKLDLLQRRAWLSQIAILKNQLSAHPRGYLFFEFSIPRMGKRADVLFLYKGIVFVIEFKVGSRSFDRHAIEQVHDYALDLKNFHLGSHPLPIVPILLATEAPATTQSRRVVWEEDDVATPMVSNADGLSTLLQSFDARGEIDIQAWLASGYCPTLTIIEAAETLYQGHDVSEISRSDAGDNLQDTERRIGKIIDVSKRDKRKAICFITGVPGAGKTLAGLNIATTRKCYEDEHAVFLSGNGPLVMVLQEALARDQVARNQSIGIKSKKSDALRETKSFIQNIHHFRDHYLKDVKAPFERVVVFDEAQRAWTEEQATKFMRKKGSDNNFNQSEPEFLIRVMDRHPDWCTIICLIGGGQEIRIGEAGLLGWLTALKEHFPHWLIHASFLLEDKYYTIDEKATEMLQESNVEKHRDLHLSVPMRSFRSERLNAFVSEMLGGDAQSAREISEELINRYPIVLTRELNCARAWLRERARGSERFGLVASSGGNRLRAEGLNVKTGIDSVSWFLNDREDVRSSYYLEEVATQFESQGLELDWVGLCWDADLRRANGEWKFHGFRGTQWQNLQDYSYKLYLLNSYRVLLTRARQGFVIFVPRGNPSDATRLPKFYDETYEYLRECGVLSLDL